MLRFPGLWWGLGFAGVSAAIAMSLLPDLPNLPGDSRGLSAHLIVYAVMMGWFARLELRGSRRIAWAIGLCALGVGIEFAQQWTGRQYDETDMVANAIGILLGWLVSPPRVPSGITEIDRWIGDSSATE